MALLPMDKAMEEGSNMGGSSLDSSALMNYPEIALNLGLTDLFMVTSEFGPRGSAVVFSSSSRMG